MREAERYSPTAAYKKTGAASGARLSTKSLLGYC